MHLLVDSPIGPLGVSLAGGTVVGVRFGAPPGFGRRASHPAVDEIAAYFAGELTIFSVPVEMRGGTDFERAVWAEIAKIPYGEMRTYGAIAATLGDPTAARTVGLACNHNPVPIIVPCHRVVGAGGKMVGFGGGIDRKRRLLELEARISLAHQWGIATTPAPSPDLDE